MYKKIVKTKGEKKMKKVIMFIIVVMLSINVSSCSKDDKNNIIAPENTELKSVNCTLIFFYDKEVKANYYMQSFKGEGLNPYHFVNDSCLGYYDITGTRTLTKYDSLKLFSENTDIYKFVIAYCSDKIDTVYFGKNEKFEYVTYTDMEMCK